MTSKQPAALETRTHTVRLSLSEAKKHSGKYVVKGTESAQYPQYYYLPKLWFDGQQLPTSCSMTVTW